MTTSVPKHVVQDARKQLKLTRNKIAMVTTMLGVDSAEMTVEALTELLESLCYSPVLETFLQENYRL